MNCKTCNFSLTEDQLVCPVCGTEVVTDKPLEMEEPQTEPVMDQTPQIELTPAEPVMDQTPQVELTPAEPVMDQTPQVELTPAEPVMDQTPQVELTPAEPVMDQTPQVELTPAEPVMDQTPQIELTPPEPVLDQTPQVELTPAESVMDQTPQVELTPPEPVLDQTPQLELTPAEPVMDQTPQVELTPAEPVMDQAPLPTNNLSLEQNESGADFGTVKPQKKGLGIVLKILITLLVVLGAAAVGYFGFKYFFNTPQEANFQGYKYRISGAYSAVIQSNEKLLVDESKDSSKSKWKIVIETSDMPAGSFNELKEKQDEIKANIEGENIVNSVEAKKVNNLDMLVFDINTSAKKAAYIVYLLNNGNSALKANIEFKEAKIPKTLEDLAEIINTAKKS